MSESKRRLLVNSDRPITEMCVLGSPTRHLTALPTSPGWDGGG